MAQAPEAAPELEQAPQVDETDEPPQLPRQASEPSPAPIPIAALEEERAARERASQLKEILLVKKEQNRAAATQYRAPTGSVSGETSSAKTGLGNSGGGALASSDSISQRKEYSSASAPESIPMSPEVAAEIARERAQRLREPTLEEKAYAYDVNGRLKAGRKPASLEKLKSGESKEVRATEDPWLAFMTETSSNSLVAQIKKDASLKDRLRQRLEELKKTPNSEDRIGFIEDLLAKAEEVTEADKLAELRPLTAREAFAMDAGETQEEIRRFLAELDREEKADPQFLPTETLFKRVTSTHRRSIANGKLKLKP